MSELTISNVLTWLKEYWWLITAVVGVISGAVGWKLKPRVERLLDVAKLEATWAETFDKMRGALSGMSGELTSLQSQVSNLRAELNTAQQERQSQDEVIKTQEARLNKQAAEISHLYDSIARLRLSFRGYVNRLIGAIRAQGEIVEKTIMQQAGPEPAELDEDETR